MLWCVVVSGVCVRLCIFLCAVCAVCFAVFEYACVLLLGMFCVMMYGLLLCLCLCDSFSVFACGVCGMLCDAVWCVVLVCVIAACLCVLTFMCSWVLFVIYCVVMYGLVSCASCLFVSVPCFRHVVFAIDSVMLYLCEIFNVCVRSMCLCVLCVMYCVAWSACVCVDDCVCV